MATKRSERVKLMIDNFLQDFTNGMSIDEIEKKYAVSKGYAYRKIPEIAKHHGVDPEIFYQREHGEHMVIVKKDGTIITSQKCSIEEINKAFEEAEKLLEESKKNIDILIEDMRSALNELEEQEEKNEI